MVKITTKKVIDTGKQHRKVLDVKMLKREDLPSRYTDEGVSVFLLNKGQVGCHTEHGDTIQLNPDFLWFGENSEPIAEVEFQEKIAFCHKCGKRLQEINKEIDRANAGWHGTETFII